LSSGTEKCDKEIFVESVGINIGYLLLSLLCLGAFLAALAGGVYLAARMAYGMSAKIDDSELVMSFTVTDEGIVIPKSELGGAETVELRRTRTKLILHPVVKE
jgi:hypothetical protein